VTEVRKELGVREAVALVVTSIVGSTIFIMPGVVAAKAGPLSILGWVISGALTVPMALCFAELAGLYEKAGGPYVYVGDAFGRLPGLIVGWSLTAVSWAVISLLAVGFALYSSYIFPNSQQFQTLIAIAAILSFTLLNYLGVRLSATALNLLALGTVAILLVFILGSLPFVRPSSFTPFAPYGWLALGPVLVLTFVPYMGLEVVALPAEEFKNPRRDIPVGILVGTIIVIAVYVLLSYTSLGTIGWQRLGASSAPIAEAAEFAFGKLGGFLIDIGALVTILGCLNCSIFTFSRLTYAMGRDQAIPPLFATLDTKYSTPSIALLFQAVLSTILVISGTFEKLAYLTAYITLLIYVIIFLAYIKLRNKASTSKAKAFKAPFGNLMAIAAIIFCVILLAYSDLWAAVWGSLLMLLSIPVYYAQSLVKTYNKS